MPSNRVALVLAALFAAACGGDEAEPVDAAPAQGLDSSAVQVSAEQAQADSAERAAETSLNRETFSYRGGARDPFESLFNLANAGPEIQDLELVGIYLDPERPGFNIAVLRERNTGRPHKLRAGDQLGRARVAQIRRTDIVFTIEDFGFERQETIALPKREEGTP